LSLSLENYNPYISKMPFTLAQQMVRALNILQGLFALPIMMVGASVALDSLGGYSWFHSQYDFLLVLAPPPIYLLL
jgi:hypothetical protein